MLIYKNKKKIYIFMTNKFNKPIVTHMKLLIQLIERRKKPDPREC